MKLTNVVKFRSSRPLLVLAGFFFLTGVLSSAAVAGVPGPTFTKVFSPDTIGPGSVSTLTFTIANGEPTPVTMMDFSDTLPVGVTIATPANASTDCLGAILTTPDGGGTITFSDGLLGGSSTCFVSVDVTSSTPGTHMNTSSVLTSSANDSGTASDDLTVATDRPGFSKSFMPSSVSLGGRSTLTFTIDNTLNISFAVLLAFTDDLPVGMVIAGPSNAATTCPGWTLTAVPGQSVITLSGSSFLLAGATCTVTVDVIGSGVGTLTNVSGELTSLLPPATLVSSGKASDVLTVMADAISLEKDFTDDPVPAGGTVNLEFTIANLDRNFSATSIAFTDVLPGGLSATGSMPTPPCGIGSTLTGTTTLTFAGGTLPPEGVCTFSVTLTAGTTTGTFTNTTSAITADVDGLMVMGDPASEIVVIQPVPLLTKEFVDDPVNAGDDVILRFTITNTSTTSAATDIAFIDELTTFLPFPVTAVLPATPCNGASSISLVFLDVDVQALSLTGGTLMMPGEMCTFDVTLTIPAGMASGTFVNTTTEITATVDAVTVAGKPASDSLEVVAAPSLTKAFTDDPVAPDGTVTLEFTLTHSLNAVDDATDIEFTDDLAALAPAIAGLTANLPPSPDPPCGAGSSLTGSAGDTLLTFEGGTLTPGESCTFSVTLDVPSGAASGSHANTTSDVTATQGASMTTSPPATDDLNVSGLTFTKEFVGDPVIAGDTLLLRFTIENVHPTDDATISFFTDNLAADLSGLAATGGPSINTCGGALSGTTSLVYIGGSVVSGEMCTIEVEVLVPLGAADGTYRNVTSALVTDVGTIDPATDELTVGSNLLQLTKSFTDDPVAPGGSVTLEFNLTNLDAGQAASDIDFTDELGDALSGLTFDSELFDDCGATVSGTGTTTITVDDASLGIGGTCTIRVSLTVPGAAAAGIYTNTTSAVTGTIGGLAVTGDAASADLAVVQLLLFTKAFDGPTTANGTATLTFTITNPGADTATDISFSDDLDAVISGLIATSLPALPCGTGSSLTGMGFLAFTGGELPPMGGMCSFHVEVLVPATATPGTFPNVTSELFVSGLPVADPATADLTIELSPVVTAVSIGDCEEVRSKVDEIDVTFNELLQDPAGDGSAVDVTNPDSWRLVAAGGDKDVTTVACAGAPVDDDTLVVIDSVSYAPGSSTATLMLADPLPSGPYKLMACTDGLHDVDNDLGVDGDANGSEGPDFVRFFRVELDNRFLNGNFDCNLDGWDPVTTGASVVFHDLAMDKDDAGISGSAHMLNDAGNLEVGVSQCVAVGSEETVDLTGSFFLTTAGITVEVFRTCESFAAGGCAGASLGFSVLQTLVTTDGVQVPVGGAMTMEPGAASALCVWTAERNFGGFDGFFDGLTMTPPTPPGLIFEDGFESGDTSAWSSEEP